jgi:hypothetical protein
MEPVARVLGEEPTLTLPNHALFVGASQSGKTRLALHLITNPHLFSPQPKLIIFHYDQFQEAYLAAKSSLASKGVELRLKKGCNGISLDNLSKQQDQTLLLIDDFSEETASNPEIARIATNGRHLNLSLWLVWHSLFSKHAASRVICQNLRWFFFLPSPRLESQLRTLGAQLSMAKLLLWAFKTCQEDQDEEHKYLLLDVGPRTPSILRLRSHIHNPLSFCYADV